MATKIQPFTRSIARALLAIRRARKLSQARVSHLMSVEGVEIHRSTISRIERGQLDITMGDLAAFCRVYRVQVGYLMLSAEMGRLMPEAVKR